VTVKIGGVDAPVQFAGLAPGYAGLYQVNAVLPLVPAGMQAVTMKLGSLPDSVPVTIAVQ
jgi:uncharacterized protein (TIGR03437 family)